MVYLLSLIQEKADIDFRLNVEKRIIFHKLNKTDMQISAASKDKEAQETLQRLAKMLRADFIAYAWKVEVLPTDSKTTDAILMKEYNDNKKQIIIDKWENTKEFMEIKEEFSKISHADVRLTKKTINNFSWLL